MTRKSAKIDTSLPFSRQSQHRANIAKLIQKPFFLMREKALKRAEYDNSGNIFPPWQVNLSALFTWGKIYGTGYFYGLLLRKQGTQNYAGGFEINSARGIRVISPDT